MRCNELTAIMLLFSHHCVICQLFHLAANLGINKAALPDVELMRVILVNAEPPGGFAAATPLTSYPQNRNHLRIRAAIAWSTPAYC